jgi:hypothetical protein
MEKDIVRVFIAALVVAAIFDILSPTVGGGKQGASIGLATVGSKGIGALFARLTGQSPPAGF